MVKGNGLTPSLEDYLEAILILERMNKVARVKEIAASLKVQMPSVTGALKNLKKKGLVSYEKNSYITLTGKGRIIALSVENRHLALACFLKKILLVPVEEAQTMACKIEHSITPDIALRFHNCTKYIENEIFLKKAVSTEEWEKLLKNKL